MALSPDGMNVVIATSIIVCSYRVLDAVENWCNTIGETPDASIQSLAFDPSGKTVVTGLKVGLENGEIILWDVSKGVQNLVIQTDLNLMSNPTWSPDGQKLAYTGSDRSGLTMQIWNSRDGSVLPHIQAGSYSSNILSWSPNGSIIAGGDFSGLITLWDARSGDVLSIHQIFPKQHAISSLAWSPDSAILLAGSSFVSCAENCTPTYDGKIAFLDTATGATLRQIPVGQMVNNLALSPDGSQLLAGVGLGSNEIRLYRISDGSLRQRISQVRTDISIPAIKNAFWFPDSQSFLTLNGEDNLAEWDTSGAKRSESHLDGYPQLSGLAWSPDGSQLASSSSQGLFIWDILTGQLLRRFGFGDQAPKIAWSPDGKTLASAKDKQVFLWDAQTGKQLRLLPASGDYPRDLSWSPDGRLFASLFLSGVPGEPRYCFIDIWDAHAWTILKVIKVDNWDENNIEYFAWSPDGKTLAASGIGIYLFDSSSGKLINSFGQNSSAYGSIAWSLDGSMLVTSVGAIWDVKTGSSLILIIGVISAALSPDGKILATGGEHIILHDTRNGAKLLILKDFANRANQLVFSPDGKTLASSSQDGTILLWDIPSFSTLPSVP